MKVLKRAILVILGLGIAVIAFMTYLGYQQYQSAIEQVSIKEKVAEIREQEHFVAYEDISPELLKATVAIEDHRFFEHRGFDYIATTRALLSNLVNSDIVGGGSTITQQLAKNMYFGYQPSFVRKIAELFVAHELERMYSKEEILTLYVNIINYGDNHIGILEAANGYFNVSPSELTLNQASLLAGLPQSPSNLQLSNHYAEALIRQQTVLKAMVKEEMITETQAQACIDY